MENQYGGVHFTQHVLVCLNCDVKIERTFASADVEGAKSKVVASVLDIFLGLICYIFIWCRHAHRAARKANRINSLCMTKKYNFLFN